MFNFVTVHMGTARTTETVRAPDTGNENDNSSYEPLGIRAKDYTLKVLSPKRVVSNRGEYTTYCICLQTSSAAFRLEKSKTRRRFSEFPWLRNELAKVDNWRSPPPLPSKRFWNLFDSKFIEIRRRDLEQWIHQVLSDSSYLSSTAVHLFLQTELKIEQIQQYLNGQMSEDEMEEIWNNHGKLYNYQAHNLLHNNFHQDPMEIHYTFVENPETTATGDILESNSYEDEDNFSQMETRAHENGRIFQQESANDLLPFDHALVGPYSPAPETQTEQLSSSPLTTPSPQSEAVMTSTTGDN